ncbi:Major facilitator superfamily domain-containing protein 8 [Armadillidium vulgare]|nr:Major facilitator superfamily domain-containing protein 8 [Armadillidium vulgare]
MNSQKETDTDVEDRLLEVQVSSDEPVVTNNHESSEDKDALRTESLKLQNVNGNNLKLKGPILVNARNEDPYSRKQRKKSHLVIYATTFIMSIGFSIVITGVWPYLQMLDPSTSKHFLGWAIAVNPLGQMIASPLLGWYGVKRGTNR